MSEPIQQSVTPVWKKALGYFVIAMVAVLLLRLLYDGSRLLVLAFHQQQTSLGARLLQLLVAVLILAIPGFFAFVLLRRRWRNGTFKLSPEERAKALTKCRTPQSLTKRVLLAVVWCGIAILNTDTALYAHYHHNMPWITHHALPWITLALNWLCATLYIGQVFRPRTCDMPDPLVPIALNLNRD